MIGELDKVKEFILKHCGRKAKDKNVPVNNIQVRFTLSEDGSELMYATCQQYKKFEDTDFSTICNFTFGLDIFGYGQQVPPFIHNALIYLCGKLDVHYNNIYVFATPDDTFYTKDEETGRRTKENIAVHVYKGAEYVETISVQQFVLENIMSGQQGV